MLENNWDDSFRDIGKKRYLSPLTELLATWGEICPRVKSFFSKNDSL